MDKILSSHCAKHFAKDFSYVLRSLGNSLTQKIGFHLYRISRGEEQILLRKRLQKQKGVRYFSKKANMPSVLYTIRYTNTRKLHELIEKYAWSYKILDSFLVHTNPWNTGFVRPAYDIFSLWWRINSASSDTFSHSLSRDWLTISLFFGLFFSI